MLAEITTIFDSFQYLTTVIPYHANQGPPTIDQLQIYIKSKLLCRHLVRALKFYQTRIFTFLMCVILQGLDMCGSVSVLRAINDDSPSVPGLLTDYILKGKSFSVGQGTSPVK